MQISRLWTDRWTDQGQTGRQTQINIKIDSRLANRNTERWTELLGGCLMLNTGVPRVHNVPVQNLPAARAPRECICG